MQSGSKLLKYEAFYACLVSVSAQVGRYGREVFGAWDVILSRGTKENPHRSGGCLLG
jgi:hypothetical protein